MCACVCLEAPPLPLPRPDTHQKQRKKGEARGLEGTADSGVSEGLKAVATRKVYLLVSNGYEYFHVFKANRKSSGGPCLQ